MRVRRWWIILLLCGCATAQSPTPTLTPTATPVPIRYQSYDEGGQFCPQPRSWYEYVIRPGDTIRSLAERTSSTVSQLAAANCLQNPRMLYAGQVFYLPRRLDD
ncbi:MAG TPA: LysM domain-containing protein [Oceanobacillus sp.]|nr:LysM domain-containing protein [Oceanobacillus sp.]